MGGIGMMMKNVDEDFPKEVMPELFLKWRSVVIQIGNLGQAYSMDGLLGQCRTLARLAMMRWRLDQKKSFM